MLEIPGIPYIEAFLKQLVNRIVRGVFGSLLIPSVIVTGVFVFLWFFYSAVADRIFPIEGTILGDSPGIVNPLAYQTAWSNGNWLVLFFPSIFFSLAMLVHYYWERRPRLFWVIFGFILALDFVVAIASSKKIHEYLSSQERDYDKELWSYFFGGAGYWPHVLVIIFCGFGTSLAAGALYHAFRRRIDASTDAESDDESADTENIEE